jgi:hypothetical protein
MMDWTDKHCRYFHRLLSRTLLYTEMVTTGALVHGDVARHLRFEAEELPWHCNWVARSRPIWRRHAWASNGAMTRSISTAAALAERVQRGAFGACLMNEAALVADCVKAMACGVRARHCQAPNRHRQESKATILCATSSAPLPMQAARCLWFMPQCLAQRPLPQGKP